MQLERVSHSNGPVYFVSPRLREIGVPHAFSTRLGGLSPAPFDSLNLGNPAGDIRDDRERILDNYRLLEDSAGFAGRERCWLHQIHSAVVARVGSKSPHDNSSQGDALVTSDPAFALSVRVADCCPVLLASNDGKRVAAIHSGWRGTVGDATGVALTELMKSDANGLSVAPKNIVAAIGPCIGFDAFEIGAEVLDEFERMLGADAPIRRRADEKGYADIRESIRIMLLRAGVPEQNIDTTDRCTHRDAAEFYSHRRENGVTGRMAAIIAVKR
ncbi:MAG: peptidoglycan editing factor PgeF [Planctomycetota bacterium]